MNITTLDIDRLPDDIHWIIVGFEPSKAVSQVSKQWQLLVDEHAYSEIKAMPKGSFLRTLLESRENASPPVLTPEAKAALVQKVKKAAITYLQHNQNNNIADLSFEQWNNCYDEVQDLILLQFISDIAKQNFQLRTDLEESIPDLFLLFPPESKAAFYRAWLADPANAQTLTSVQSFPHQGRIPPEVTSFPNMPLSYLQQAAQNNCLPAVHAILNSNALDQTSLPGMAIWEAAKRGFFGIVQALLNSNRQLDPLWLGSALREAKKNGFSNIDQAISNSGRQIQIMV